VIPNGLPPATTAWKGSGKTEMRLLFVGRLTRLKGLQDIIKVLPDVKGNWRLDILGDGPLRAELEEAVTSKGLKNQVTFHGFHNDPDTWMAKSDCLLFPSYIEGMPLTLARAIQIGLPVLATDIEPVCEMALKKEGLVPAGDLNGWKNAIQNFMTNQQSPAVFNKNVVTTIQQMSSEVLKIYKSVVIQ